MLKTVCARQQEEDVTERPSCGDRSSGHVEWFQTLQSKSLVLNVFWFPLIEQSSNLPELILLSNLGSLHFCSRLIWTVLRVFLKLFFIPLKKKKKSTISQLLEPLKHFLLKFTDVRKLTGSHLNWSNTFKFFNNHFSTFSLRNQVSLVNDAQWDQPV